MIYITRKETFVPPTGCVGKSGRTKIIRNELKPAVEEYGASLHCVRLSETKNNTIEYYG